MTKAKLDLMGFFKTGDKIVLNRGNGNSKELNHFISEDVDRCLYLSWILQE